MDTISSEKRQHMLDQLTDAIQRRGLVEAALLLARTLNGANVIVSHFLLAAQPLMPHSTWRRSLGDYAILLEDQASWQTLIDHLEACNS